jgi:Lon protease-like protein
MPTPEAIVAGAELDAVPVFPLPGLVLFPGQRLPLHIFEPRYRAMVRDLIGSPAPYMAVACILGDATEPVPPFCAVAGLGRLVSHQRLADGRFNILLEGVGRVRLEERPFVPPYRRARATVLAEPDPTEVDGLAQASLLAVAAGYLAEGRGGASGPVSALCLRLAERVVSDPAARQAILESATAAERVRRTTDALALERLAAQAWTASGEG